MMENPMINNSTTSTYNNQIHSVYYMEKQKNNKKEIIKNQMKH